MLCQNSFIRSGPELKLAENQLKEEEACAASAMLPGQRLIFCTASSSIIHESPNGFEMTEVTERVC